MGEHILHARAAIELAASLHNNAVRGALIVGTPGAGKTTLLQDMAGQLAGEFRFIRLTCAPVAEPASAGPSGPAKTAPAPAHGHAPALAPPSFGTLAPLLGNRKPARAMPSLAVLRQMLAHLSGLPQVPVLVADDAAELDEGSAELLAGLAGSGAVQILLSARPGVRLHDGLAELANEGLLSRHTLGPLDQREALALCRQVLGGPVLPAVALLLSRSAGGSPRNLVALLDESRRQHRLVERDGCWLPAGVLPESGEVLQDVLRRELERLTSAQCRAVYMVALAGPLRLPLLARIAGPRLFETLQAQGVLDFEPADDDAQLVRGPAVRLAPAFPAPPLRRMVPSDLSRELFERYSAAVSASPELAAEGVGPARWALDLHLTLSDSALVETARQANRSRDTALALRSAALVTAPELRPAAEVEIVRLYLRRGYAGRAALRLAGVLARATEPELLRQAALLGQEAVVRSGGGTAELDRLDQAWARAAARTPELRGERRIGRLLRHHAMQLEGRFAESIPGLRQLTAETNDDGDPVLVARTLLAEAELAVGGPSDAVGLAAETLQRLQAPAGTEAILHNSLALRNIRCLVQAGHLAAAAAQLDRFEHQRMESLVVFGGTVEFLRAWIVFRQGRLHEALQMLTAVVQALRLQDPHQLLQYALGLTADAAGQLDEPDILAASSEAFRDLLMHGRRNIHAAMPVTARARIIAAGVAAGVPFALGAVPAAPPANGSTLDVEPASRGELAVLAAALACAGRITEEAEVQLLRLRLDDSDALQRLRDLTAGAGGMERDLLHVLAEALLAKDAEALLAMARAAAAAGYLLLAAEAARHAARLLAGQGTGGRHRDAVRLLQKLRRQLPGVVSSLQLDELHAPGQLTIRERAVAMLAACGLRGPDIAQQLGSPVRTVEGHLYRIYDKLRVHSRSELAAALREPTPALAAAAGPALAEPAFTERPTTLPAAVGHATAEPARAVSGAR
ncbi:LuxR C-terminal-related transcriptional regulator [Arthrobacter crystallopoietes]|uniref:helix-turn-helix transcriptional regulator n=1 Tax=Crystallibacter crystallopoietes TaxID=37928 RepID=UPI003D19EC48